MSANEKQVGGSHYKVGGEEHWDRVYRLFGPGYFIGCITKYVERYQSKNGYEDLLKAQHFLEKLVELEGQKPKASTSRQDLHWAAFKREREDAENALAEKMSRIQKEPDLKVETPKFAGVMEFNIDWQNEGYYGDNTCLFKCRHCRATVRATDPQAATQAHGACAKGRGYVQQG